MQRQEPAMKTTPEETSDPKVHARNVHGMLTEIVDHLRQDIDRIDEPKGQALFETGAEVLIGLRTAFDHYATGAEKAMK
jgi:hypothetical protein